MEINIQQMNFAQWMEKPPKKMKKEPTQIPFETSDQAGS